MNTPTDITPFDLLQLAHDELVRLALLAEESYDWIAGVRLARELVREAVEVAAERAQDGADGVIA